MAGRDNSPIKAERIIGAKVENQENKIFDYHNRIIRSCVLTCRYQYLHSSKACNQLNHKNTQKIPILNQASLRDCYLIQSHTVINNLQVIRQEISLRSKCKMSVEAKYPMKIVIPFLFISKEQFA